VLQLAQRLRLDLTDALARHRELPADFSIVWSVFMPMPKRMRSTRSWRRQRRDSNPASKQFFEFLAG